LVLRLLWLRLVLLFLFFFWMYLLVFFQCVLSAVAGVYTEYLFKRTASNDSNSNIHFQNMQLYSWGIMINGLEGMRQKGLDKISTEFFEGKNIRAQAQMVFFSFFFSPPNIRS